MSGDATRPCLATLTPDGREPDRPFRAVAKLARMANDTVTLTIEGDSDADELTVPSDLLDLLREGDETDPAVVGDIAMFGLAQRIHGAVHHGQGDADQEIQDLEELTLDLFEERFGASFAELTGHDH